MTEKRSDYRKKQSKSYTKIFDKIKSAFIDNQEFSQNDQSEFSNSNKKEEMPKRRSLEGNGQPTEPAANYNLNRKQSFQNEKGLRLKKRLNWTILILIVLIGLVLLALFHL